MIGEYGAGAIEAEDPLKAERSWRGSFEEEKIYHLPSKLTELELLLASGLSKEGGIGLGYEELREIKPEKVEVESEILGEVKLIETVKEVSEEFSEGGLYVRDKEPTKPPGKLDVEGFRHWKNIDDLTSTFKQTGDLKPEEMLSLLESENYGVINKKGEVWRVDLENIKEVKEKYYKDVPPIPGWLEELLQDKKAISIEKARKLLDSFVDFVKGLNLSKKSEKSFVRLVERMLINHQ